MPDVNGGSDVDSTPTTSSKASQNASTSIISITCLLILGALFRFILIIYGVYHDNLHSLKYTDVDYTVFADAASYIYPFPSQVSPGFLSRVLAENYKIYIGTPYDRLTYRYTPLLALFMIPNTWIPLFGKFLFSAADLGIALIQYRILTGSPSSYRRQATSPDNTTAEVHEITRSPSVIPPLGVSEKQAKILISTTWLFNPFVANISTRGSAESLLGLIILMFMFLLQQDRLDVSAIVFGLAVHFKLYPIIYAPTILAYLATPSHWLNLKQVRFGVISFASLMSLNIAMYLIWGMPFVEHAYLYHFKRLDHRHNFSHYFYEIYLSISKVPLLPFSASDGFSSDTQSHSRLLALASKFASSTFAPQLALSLSIGFFITRSKTSASISRRPHASNRNPDGPTAAHLQGGGNNNLAAILFIQTLVFTSFNRVCTSQYFMWYLWFLPLALPSFHLSWKKGMAILAAWIGGQAIWLSIAYRLEFLGEAVFLQLWFASGLFFSINATIVYVLLATL